MNLEIVLITDQTQPSLTIAKLLRAWTRHAVHVEQADYEMRYTGVWNRWMADVHLFVITLDRHYPDGIRAEGAAVAEFLVRSGKKVLVVGKDRCPPVAEFFFYWDLGVDRTLLKTISQCLASPLPSADEIAAFKARFLHKLEIPTGHRSASSVEPT